MVQPQAPRSHAEPMTPMRTPDVDQENENKGPSWDNTKLRLTAPPKKHASTPPPPAPAAPLDRPAAKAVDPDALRFVAAAASRQHPTKQQSNIVNADVCEAGPTLLGLCDGVSGVRDLGISPDCFPRELLQCTRQRHEDWKQRQRPRTRGKEIPDDEACSWLVGIAEDAYNATQAQGATTLILAALREGDKLVTACIGDSALLLLRPLRLHPLQLQVVFRTATGRKNARTPLQVQRLSGVDDSAARGVIRGASVQSLAIQPRDMVIMGSDGLFDNVSDEDIRLAVEWHCSGAASMGSLGMKPLPGTAAAAAAALPPPKPAFASRLREAAAALVDLAIARVPAGGNADDTTALVAVVAKEWQLMEESAQPTRRRPAGLAAARGALQQPGSFVAMPPQALFHSGPSPPQSPAAEPNVLKDRTNAAPPTPRSRKKKKQPQVPAPPLASVDGSFVIHGSGCMGPNLKTMEMAEDMAKDACPIS